MKWKLFGQFQQSGPPLQRTAGLLNRTALGKGQIMA